MQVTIRDLVTAGHGLFFGGFFLMAIFAIAVELCRSAYATADSGLTERGYALRRVYLIVTVALGWAAVFLGAYAVYPWYRAIPPAGVSNLAQYPQRLLLSSSATSGWHSLGMEWKEHVAWFAPIAMTMVAYVLTAYRGGLKRHLQAKRAVIVFTLVALAAAGIAGFFGAALDKAAPVQGGGTVTLMGTAK